MEIDNFDIFRKHLSFVEKTDRYIVHILRRPKDLMSDPEMMKIGSNEHQRLLRTYYIDSLEYFDRKISAIKELCTTNKARAYILPQVRNNYECLLNLGEKVLETIRLGNASVKPEHLLRSAYCEYKKSRNKQWIIDLDEDCMKEPLVDHNNFPTGNKTWTIDEVIALIKGEIDRVEKPNAAKKKSDEVYVVPTKNGTHIITPPFDLQSAFKKCSLMFEGVKKIPVKVNYVGPYNEELVYKQFTGWLHKDGMSLLYCNLPD